MFVSQLKTQNHSLTSSGDVYDEILLQFEWLSVRQIKDTNLINPLNASVAPI